MTRLDFVKTKLVANVNKSINAMTGNKGVFKLSVDSWEYELNIKYEVIDRLLVADIEAWNGSYNKGYNLQGYAIITSSKEDALSEVITYATKQSGYKPVDVED